LSDEVGINVERFGVEEELDEVRFLRRKRVFTLG